MNAAPIIGMVGTVPLYVRIRSWSTAYDHLHKAICMLLMQRVHIPHCRSYPTRQPGTKTRRAVLKQAWCVQERHAAHSALCLVQPRWRQPVRLAASGLNRKARAQKKVTKDAVIHATHASNAPHDTVYMPFAAEVQLTIGNQRTWLLRLADSKSYLEAQNYCRQEKKGDLVTIASGDEQTLSEILSQYARSYFWIGLSLSKEGSIANDWRWDSTNLSSSSYTWRPDEPYDFRINKQGFEGLCADFGAADDGSFGLGANYCSAPQPYICQLGECGTKLAVCVECFLPHFMPCCCGPGAVDWVACPN